jgi:DNA-binding XRE family transcriptional regulator
MRFRNRVRQVRVASGASTYDIWRATGISRVTLRKIERDDGYQPRTRTVARLMEHFGRMDLFWYEPAEGAA